MFENLLSINCIKPNVLCIDYSDDGSKVFLGISFNLGSEPERNIIFYILDGSNGSLVGKSIRSDKLRVAQVRNYQVEDFVYSVFTWEINSWNIVIRTEISTGELNVTLGAYNTPYGFFKIPGNDR